MSTCRVAQVAATGSPFEIVEREVLQPGPGHVRVIVDACGICHSDSVFFPLGPGHEIAGRIEELGEENARQRLAGGRPGGDRLVRPRLRPLHALPTWRLRRVREPEGSPDGRTTGTTPKR
jgi:NADPH:quinone reductase-like Zn-dependent oxidoreductase